MDLIFLRHGEALNNVNKYISDKEIYWSLLTENGIKTVEKSIKELPEIINKVYVSPLPRTIQTANIVYQKYNNIEYIIDNRIREISYGKYSGKTNNEELDNIRIKQINGDYFTRFGDYGENKYDIEKRLCNFLEDINLNNAKDDTILIISHGSVISYMKRILNLKKPHIDTGKLEIYNNIDFKYLYEYKKIKYLNI